MQSPYSDLSPRQFWRSGVAEADGLVAPELYRKKFEIAQDMPVMTAGSCFAQHIGRNMRKNGYKVLDVERPPPGMLPDDAAKFGFGIYSGRYGNIYTSSQLLQLLREAFGLIEPHDPVWERDGRFFDAQRPSVEPNGLETREAVIAHRQSHLSAIRTLLKKARLLVFTLGLTETWRHKESGTVYPTAPGTIAGSFDPSTYEFVNLDYVQVLDDMEAVRALVLERFPGMKFLLTVSPVPLTATATDKHVMAATVYSKSVLRAVAGKLSDTYDDVDYFPSYEIITSSLSGGNFFEKNLRSVRAVGVNSVMETFFAEHGGGDPPAAAAAKRRRVEDADEDDDVVCEEALLEAFAPKS
ncbi:GSCFA domain-containing protein [Sphingomonas sabuli]|uniref:GSCFA domain-containing protein n=1 Tax=Sphingomonas sabuli TaxID=2764186 RepID=A0A7G9L4B5_9SPHN|nr:GSCFA domain-containing protein [Sphingomonas sabuli]QNM83464.1 GSCFA domain-containing protein [Sphingomonas sabuli]